MALCTGGVLLAFNPYPSLNLDPNFDFHPNDQLSEEFRRIAAHHNWNDKARTDNWGLFILDNFRNLTLFDQAGLDPLHAWQLLAQNLGMLTIDMDSITKIKKELRTVYVNIVNYLNFMRTHNGLRVFPRYEKRKFVNYTKKKAKTCPKNRRMVPKTVAKQSRGLKELLEHLN
ncbi:MAG: hypothetical protein Q9162_005171 [Coniocarpon cinnabarinum]